MLVLSAAGKLQAQDTNNLPTPMNWSAAQDHQNMMDQLGITAAELRPGPDGNNPTSPNYQNTDESTANPYPNLPDPLVLKNPVRVSRWWNLEGLLPFGPHTGAVTTPKMWWKLRRPEIVEAFDSEVYGRVPKNVPKVTWLVDSTTRTTNGGIPVIMKQLTGHVDNSSYPLINVEIQLSLTTPANAPGPVPVMMEFGFGAFNFGGGFGGSGGTNRGRGFGGTNRFAAFGGGVGGTNLARGFGGFGSLAGPNWQTLCLSNGWGYAVIVPTSYQADNGAGLTRGIIGLCNKGQARKPDDWGALRAWAWGASRALDYFETDPAVDAKQVGIEGLSRYGKAALVTMAYDQRFAIALIGSSGEGGAKLSRRHWGEEVSNLAGTGEYHWMAGNWMKYDSKLTPGDLPVDAHELLALCAPRPIFVSYGASKGGPGVEGTWLDQHGSYMATVAADSVYNLFGEKGLGVPADQFLTAPMPAINESVTNGIVAWRQHDGGHTDAPNWPIFIQWANRYIHGPLPTM